MPLTLQVDVLAGFFPALSIPGVLFFFLLDLERHPCGITSWQFPALFFDGN